MDGDSQSAAIVVIDDDAVMRMSCRKILEKNGHTVETFENGALGLEGIARIKPDLALVDLKMPGLSGTEVIARVHDADPGIVIVVITGYATIDTAVGAMKCGAYDFLPKPFSPDELRLIVNRGLERRRLLAESRRAEVERELLKRRFVTFVSHQLQTPLAAIHQYLDVLNHIDGAARSEWIERCLERTAEMQALIRNWLTLARLEGGCLARERVRVDLKPVVDQVVAVCAPAAVAAGVAIEIRVPAACAVRGDRTCLGVLVENLVTNAVKYNRQGGRVAISAESGGAEVLLSVSDTGIGIPEKCRALLFEEFFRVDGGRARSPGTGLGLSICRRIVAEMGGAIAVESEEGAGSTFRVRLPAWQDEAAFA